MATNPIQKSLGMYNSSNPMINGETKDEVSALLTSYFNDKSASIQNDIYKIVTSKLEGIFSQQHNQISSIRSNLDNLYSNYLNEFDSNGIIEAFREKSLGMNEDCLQLRNIIGDYEERVKELCQNSKDVGQVDAVIRDIDQLINVIQSNVTVIDCDMQGDGNIDVNGIQNHFIEEMNQLNGMTTINNRMNAMPVVDKAIEGLEEAHNKLNETKKSEWFGEKNKCTIDVSTIKQYKRRPLY